VSRQPEAGGSLQLAAAQLTEVTTFLTTQSINQMMPAPLFRETGVGATRAPFCWLAGWLASGLNLAAAAAAAAWLARLWTRQLHAAKVGRPRERNERRAGGRARDEWACARTRNPS